MSIPRSNSTAAGLLRPPGIRFVTVVFIRATCFCKYKNSASRITLFRITSVVIGPNVYFAVYSRISLLAAFVLSCILLYCLEFLYLSLSKYRWRHDFCRGCSTAVFKVSILSFSLICSSILTIASFSPITNLSIEGKLPNAAMIFGTCLIASSPNFTSINAPLILSAELDCRIWAMSSQGLDFFRFICMGATISSISVCNVVMRVTALAILPSFTFDSLKLGVVLLLRNSLSY